MDVLIGPDKGSERLIKKDPLQITREQFARMHTVILEYLVGIFLRRNPSFSDRLKEGLVLLRCRNPDQSRLFQIITGMKEPNLMVAGCALWEELVAIADSKQGTTALDAYPVTCIFGKIGVDAITDIEQQLSSRPR